MSIYTDLGADNSLVRLWLRFRAAYKKCRLTCGPYAWDLTKDSRVIRISPGQFASVGRLISDFDDLFEALQPTRTGRRMLLDFSRLHVHTYREAGLQFEFAQWPEPDAPLEAYFDAYQPGSKDLIFDLGAQYGVSTYLLSQVSGTVVAFEPEFRVRTILERNVGRHALANVKVPKETVPSLAELVRIYGEPSYCKINLDRITPEFLSREAELWTNRAIFIAARSTSKRVRSRFVRFLTSCGYVIDVDHGLGMLWASPGGRTF